MTCPLNPARSILAAALVAAPAQLAVAATADLQIVDAVVRPAPEADSVFFQIEFDRAVDFTTGRGPQAYAPDTVTDFRLGPQTFSVTEPGAALEMPPVDSFQILLAGDAGAPTADTLWVDVAEGEADWQRVARGDEIHDSGGVVFRDLGDGTNTDPDAGGWGDVVGSSSLYTTEDGSVVEFYAAKTWLGLEPDAQHLAFELTASVDGVSTDVFIPTPGAAAAGLAGLAVLLLRRRAA